MLLRPRQEVFVSRVVAALAARGNTLGVAPTGAGKSVMIAAAASRAMEHRRSHGRILVLQHRDELVSQNLATFRRFTGAGPDAGRIDSSAKDWEARALFAMVPTLAVPENLQRLPPVDMLAIDEAHHAAAPTYRQIVEHTYRLNPNMLLLGVTATPGRGDNQSLRCAFDNCADEITIGELIRAGNLVPPRTLVVDVGVQNALRRVRRKADDFDMQAVAEILNNPATNDEVLRHWKARAADRQTIVFCSTVEHARDVAEAFVRAGVTADTVDGSMSVRRRREIIRRFDAGELQVLTNANVLTEGFDSQPVGCVILLRPCSFKSTYIQMVGRGLRTIDPERYPGVVKRDCVVMDFGITVATHGRLEMDVEAALRDEAVDDGGASEAPTKACPGCQGRVHAAIRTCPLCGHEWPPEEKAEVSVAAIGAVRLVEVDVILESPFRWELFDDGANQMYAASAIDAWAVVWRRPIAQEEVWLALGWANGGLRLLGAGGELQALALADDHLRLHGDQERASKAAAWLSASPTGAQLAALRRLGGRCVGGGDTTRYRASCQLSVLQHRAEIAERARAWLGRQKAA